MVIHAVELACAADSGATFARSVNSVVAVWLTNFIAWGSDGDLSQSNDPPELVTMPEEVEYYRGGYQWNGVHPTRTIPEGV